MKKIWFGNTKTPTNLFGHGQALWVRDGCKFLFFQLLNCVLVISQVQLGANEDNGSVGTVVSDLWVPLPINESVIHM